MISRPKYNSGGIDENSFTVLMKANINIVKAKTFHLNALMIRMDQICISYNEEISINKEYIKENIKLPWQGNLKNGGTSKEKNVYNNIRGFYEEITNLKSTIENDGLNHESRAMRTFQLKWYVLIIEGVMYGVQWWSSLVTNRYNEEYASEERSN